MIDNHDGTITDEATGLMWQQETPKAMTYFNADTYCGDLTLGGHIDWRLPTITELQTLVVHGKKSRPLIDTKYFQCLDNIDDSANTHFFISRSPCNDQPFWGGRHGDTWGVEFDYGYDFIAKKTVKHNVRAVRTIKSTTDRPKNTQLGLKL